MTHIVVRTHAKNIYCDKCSRVVWDANNAVLVDAEVQGFTVLHLTAQSRHFLPVYRHGRRVCSGSPSRAQYIEGQPRDTRGYTYRKEDERVWRRAYRRVKRRHKRGSTPS